MSEEAKTATRIQRSIRIVSSCSGDCLHCDHCQLKMRDLDEHNIVFASYCDVDKVITPYSNTIRELKQETLGALRYELERPMARCMA